MCLGLAARLLVSVLRCRLTLQVALEARDERSRLAYQAAGRAFFAFSPFRVSPLLFCPVVATAERCGKVVKSCSRHVWPFRRIIPAATGVLPPHPMQVARLGGRRLRCDSGSYNVFDDPSRMEGCEVVNEHGVVAWPLGDGDRICDSA
ncbi:hypothetical protein BJ875DRAFT_140421 [Amylocarpus encephaloides]|uniref:Secreted protein n=1 Tax=Amylocarpus encephaloides TaxID=45428 RepID=A0A9P7YBS9_9HELO|nr:hypothetical protein BJ875DRAFT_140421 [Amylocarpus encephaloides]